MEELLQGVFGLSFWGKMADFHGTLAMISLILFGAGILLFVQSARLKGVIVTLKWVLLALFINLATLDILGLTVYVPYRAFGGPRSELLATDNLAWLHTIVFEHKEFLAFAPVVLIFAAFFVVSRIEPEFSEEKFVWLRRSVGAAILLSLVFVLIVAAEAVLVTKTVPL